MGVSSFLVFRTHLERDVGKESHLLASRDTRMSDVGHGGAGGESVVVAGWGSRSEGLWKAKRVRSGQLGRSPGRFLDRSPKSGFIPSASLRRLNPTWLRYTEQSEPTARYNSFFPRPPIFSYVLDSIGSPVYPENNSKWENTLTASEVHIRR